MWEIYKCSPINLNQGTNKVLVDKIKTKQKLLTPSLYL